MGTGMGSNTKTFSLRKKQKNIRPGNISRNGQTIAYAFQLLTILRREFGKPCLPNAISNVEKVIFHNDLL